MSALERFAAKCEFDSTTGCVLWIGGKTSGRGNTAKYGSFWYEGRRWYAHRWAAVFIHGLNVDGVETGHCCPHGPNTLCVEHLEPTTKSENVAERNTRVAFESRQTNEQRQFWLFVALGIERFEQKEQVGGDTPFFEPPQWFKPFMPKESDECPF